MQESDYEDLLEKRRRWYKTIGKVYCPALETNVVFNSRGFKHLLYGGRGKLRPLTERFRRLNLLPQAISIVKKANHIHERRIQGESEYWEILKRCSQRVFRVSVILSRNGIGQIIFLSII